MSGSIDTGALVRHPSREELLMVEWEDEGQASCGYWSIWWDWMRELLPTKELTVFLGSNFPRDRGT